MAWLIPLHPRLVHFPIALSLTGIAFIILGVLRGREQWIAYGRLSLLLAWIGVMVSAGTGLIDQSSAPDMPAVTTVLNQHISAGLGLIIVFGLALYWPMRYRRLFDNSRQRWLYLALLMLGAGLVLLEGWLGGQLVYHLGVGVTGH